MGAQLAVIADNKDEDTDMLVMADDGRGATIHIPSFLINKRDGDLLKEHLTEGKHIVVKASL